MQRLIIDVDDKYMGFIVDMLSNLKQNIVKNISIEEHSVPSSTKNHSQRDRFHDLVAKSNNKVTLTMDIATDTTGMTNDGIF